MGPSTDVQPRFASGPCGPDSGVYPFCGRRLSSPQLLPLYDTQLALTTQRAIACVWWTLVIYTLDQHERPVSCLDSAHHSLFRLSHASALAQRPRLLSSFVN
jgi:hypothetical protein